jgi:mannan endo-1,4-beta-mannosidase
MFRKLRLPAITLFIALPAVLLLSASSSAIGCLRGHGNDFVQRHGSQLTLQGKPFRFGGTNNYYLMYQSTKMTDAVLDKAAANGFDVVRTWAWFDVPSVAAGQADKHVYFQYWDGTKPAYNDGADGLQKLDYVVAAAGERGLKLVLPLTNNWSDFGGMDQYVGWAGGSYHGDFYTNPTIRKWFKGWINHLLNHTNSITGIKYKDDPTIMTWELANEPRCKGSGGYPAGTDCTVSTITKWASEMSAYIKSIDRNHLVSSGSEGMLCEPNKPGAAGDWTRGCSTGEGVDELAISKLPTIDVMSYHLYPDSWGKASDPAWAIGWIKEHIKLAHRINKASMLGEYGLKDKTTRNPVYKSWTDTVLHYGGTGALYWILSDIQDDGSLYGDYDGFTVYCPSPVCTTISNFANVMARRAHWSKLPPVADNLSARILTGDSATMNPADSAVAYGFFNAPVASTIDLDPATAGQQKQLNVAGGQFALDSSGAVTFTSTAGVTGDAVASYTIADKRGRVSNEAKLSVTVLPIPGVPFRLFDFETASESAWSGGAAQSTAFASHGTYGLALAGAEGWYEYDFPVPVSMSPSNGYTTIAVDAWGPASWGYLKVALKTGSGWSWCEGAGVSVPPGGPTTVTYDLLTMGCTDLSDVRAMLLYSKGGVDTGVDNIWAK